MVIVFVDGHQVNVEKGSTILQACAQVGVEIPRFCYHERLSIAGNCRMCLVEVEKSAKPVASCAMPVMEGMKVFTNTNLVKKAREGVLEFLLINHPLDCPICDQGGECDLQDQAMAYGSDRGRFYEFKRGVDDKNIGPLVKTIMTRCIHCTRCIRFAAEIAGVEDLGTVGRGRDTEVGTYIEKAFQSELSGNVIDLCPVGALTSKPYAFTARSWELKSTESIDVLDALGSNIRIDVRGSEIMRILPRLNDDVNEEWISDKTRFAYDGLKRQRLTTPMIRQNDQFIQVSWEDAFETIRKKLSPQSKVQAFAGDLADTESLVVLRDLFHGLGTQKVQSLAIPTHLSPDLRVNYLANTTLAGLEDSDVCLLLGINPRFEATLVNTRLRKSVLLNQLSVYSIGNEVDLTYPHTHLGNDVALFAQIVEGRHPFCQVLRKAKKPTLLIGKAFLETQSFSLVEELTRYLPLVQKDWNGVNVIHLHASSVGSLDVGYQSHSSSDYFKNDSVQMTYLLGVDDEAFVRQVRQQSEFVVYQGHHGDVGALYADVILPGSAYTEKTSLYVNLEGRPQKTKLAFYPAGEARQDWKILRALSEYLNVSLPYDDEAALEKRLSEIAPHLSSIGKIQKADTSLLGHLSRKVSGESQVLGRTLDNFYMTNVISKASQTMAKCVKLIQLPY
uniref:NADH dehydrogenase subunit 11 n=1 Tax=Andalucia godoyi TaxID=505711 RepID=M4QKH5_ANDGO|nr:NADH dehydrogenase subunit 11 [Andalucia godoyi]AGH23973.1 NADH dehydrogenase subunit 11 [Andalucia godoyi]